MPRWEEATCIPDLSLRVDLAVRIPDPAASESREEAGSWGADHQVRC